MQATQAKERGTELRIRFEGKPNAVPELHVHVFDAGGRHVESATVDDGTARLKADTKALRGTRIFVAPTPPERFEKKSLSLQAMERRFAYEPVLSRPIDGRFELLPIPEFHWQTWLWRPCRVKGRVQKPVVVNGSSVDMPVCGARVHICEVDRIWLVLPQIPKDVLFQLRDEVLQIRPEFQPPVPRPPFPDPPFDELERFPGFPDSPELVFEGRVVAANARDEESAPRVLAESFVGHRLAPEAQADFAQALTSDAIIAAIRKHHAIIFPWLCLWRWTWPWLYRCDELAVVETDALGRFDTTVWYQLLADHPDLYFWVEYPIGDEYATVYRPPIPCATYWDFDCDSEVEITVYHPQVEVCGDVPELTGVRVEAVKIGSAGFVSRIEQASVNALIQGELVRTRGTIEGIDDSSGFPQPFGGTLAPRVFFGSELITAGITHYRWSYRRLEQADGTAVVGDPFKAIDAAVSRRYLEEAPSGNRRKFYPLGPDPAYSDTVFKIPRNFAHELELTDVPALGSVPNPDGLFRSWIAEEYATASLDSLFSGSGTAERLADAGLYELKLELFRIVGTTPQRVSMPKDDWHVPDAVAPATADSVPAPAPFLVEDPADSTKATGLRFVIRVDNNICEASIDDVEVDGDFASTDCGFVDYASKTTSDATLAFRAAHANGFARFDFDVVRGNGNHRPDAEADGMVVGPVDGFALDADGKFRKPVPVSHLLENCDEAAFGERLYVRALATNGTSRLTALDRGALAAFALEPQPLRD